MHCAVCIVYGMETETNTETMCGCGVPGCSGTAPYPTGQNIPAQRKGQ